jgi:hypothetical protein
MASHSSVPKESQWLFNLIILLKEIQMVEVVDVVFSENF